MNAIIHAASAPQPTAYARAVAASKRARWDLDGDVLNGRKLDANHYWLPDELSLASNVEFLTDSERRFFSQVQGRTYANVFGLVERFINAKVLELSQAHSFGDQVALEALVRFSDEELKHQELFRRMDALAAQEMPPGYMFMPEPNAVASVVLGKSTWAVLGLTLLIELFTQTHYKKSIAPAPGLSELYRDVFRFHWVEESQHAVLDEIEWRQEDRRLSPEQRDAAVDDLIALVGAVDGILQAQSSADARYFQANAGRAFSASQCEELEAMFLRAYRYQYILSGVQETKFVEVLQGFVDAAQFARVGDALAPLM